MTDNAYGPDKPCRRISCIAATRSFVQDAQARAIAAGCDPVDVLADGLPDAADHLGGAHLDPADREHYDGIRVNAMPEQVRKAAAPLLTYTGSYAGPPATTTDSALRALAETALDAAFNEIDRLRQQVAAVRVDADRKVREASERALDCDDHGRVIAELEAQRNIADKVAERHERARLVLLGEHQAIRDLVDAYRAGTTRTDLTIDQLIDALERGNAATGRAHKRVFNAPTRTE